MVQFYLIIFIIFWFAWKTRRKKKCDSSKLRRHNIVKLLIIKILDKKISNTVLYFFLYRKRKITTTNFPLSSIHIKDWYYKRATKFTSSFSSQMIKPKCLYFLSLSLTFFLSAHRLRIKLKTIILSHLTRCDLFVDYSFSSVWISNRVNL